MEVVGRIVLAAGSAVVSIRKSFGFDVPKRPNFLEQSACSRPLKGPAGGSSVTENKKSSTPESSIEAGGLLDAVYAELRSVAQQRLSRLPPGQTLSATALVHEAWLRIQDAPSSNWANRAQFFGAVGTLMRNILVDRAREKSALKRGGDRMRVDLEVNEPSDAEDLPNVAEALEQLEEEDPRSAQLVMLRFFVGMTLEEAAEALDVSARTARRDWAFARAWLYAALSGEGDR